jgi:hypothetical protein
MHTRGAWNAKPNKSQASEQSKIELELSAAMATVVK